MFTHADCSHFSIISSYCLFGMVVIKLEERQKVLKETVNTGEGWRACARTQQLINSVVVMAFVLE